MTTRRLAIIACGTTLLTAGCASDFLLDFLDQVDPLSWNRHTIDDSRRGADGARLGDANNDGLQDVVVSWEQSGRVVLYFNPGPAQARDRWARVVVGDVPSVEDALLVDLDADGFQDVVSCAEGGTETIFIHWSPALPDQLTSPSAWTTAPLPASERARDWIFAAPADLNADGRIDLVAGAKGSRAAIGYFRAPENPRNLDQWQWIPLADAGWIMSIIPFDLDNDGDSDIVYSDRTSDTSGVYWLENTGNQFTRREIDRPAAAPLFLDVFTNDGAPNILTATNQRTARRSQPLTPDGLAWITTSLTWSDSFGTGKAVRVADLNLDGTLDVVFSCENAGGGRFGVGFRTLDAAGNFLGARPISPNEGEKYDLIQLIDLDADGDLDVLTTEETDQLGVVWFENPTR